MTAAPIRRRGFLLVLSSPSGAGKTTITRLLAARDPRFELSVSVTTRPPRSNEVDGRDYRFVTVERFAAMLANREFLEHAAVFGNSYGTPRQPIEAALAAGRDVVADVDWQGAQQLTASVKGDLVSIFILPPSTEALAVRLAARAQDSAAVVAARMAKSAEEMSHWQDYEYVVVNAELEASIAQVQAIAAAERLRRTRQIGLADFVDRLRAG